MIQFYVCPIVQHRTPWGTSTSVGKVYTHRARGERYTVHRGLGLGPGQAVICSLESPSIETMANIAGDQECIEWPALDALWLSEVGASRRAILTEVLSAHGVPMAWVDAQTTARDVLGLALRFGVLQQQQRVAAIAQRAVSPGAELELAHEIRARRVKVVVQGVRL